MSRALTRDLKRTAHLAKHLQCRKCGATGSTLVEVGDHYECDDKRRCEIWQMRRAIKRKTSTVKK